MSTVVKVEDLRVVLAERVHVLSCRTCGIVEATLPNVASFVCSACDRARDHADEEIGWPAKCLKCGAESTALPLPGLEEMPDACLACGWSPNFARGPENGSPYARHAHPSVGGEGE